MTKQNHIGGLRPRGPALTATWQTRTRNSLSRAALLPAFQLIHTCYRCVRNFETSNGSSHSLCRGVAQMLHARDLVVSIGSCRWTETGSDDLLDHPSPSRVNWHAPLMPLGRDCASDAVSNRKTEDVHVRLSLPLRLQLCMPLGRSGAPDLRMQLFQLRLGAMGRNDEEATQCTAQAGGRCSGAFNDRRPSIRHGDQHGPGDATGDHQQTRVRRSGCQSTAAPESVSASSQCCFWPQYSAVEVAHAAGALLLAVVMLPDLAGPGTKALARHGVKVHAAAALWNWAGMLLRRHRRRAGGSRPGREGGGEELLSSPAAGRLPETEFRWQPGAAAATLANHCLSASGSAAGLMLRLCAASMLLSAGGAVWSVAHPSSCHLAAAVAALAAVLMDSKQLKRQAALGHIKHGMDLLGMDLLGMDLLAAHWVRIRLSL